MLFDDTTIHALVQNTSIHSLKIETLAYTPFLMAAYCYDITTVDLKLFSNHAGDSNVVIAPVYGRHRRFHESPALYNPHEAEAVLELLSSLLKEQHSTPAAANSGVNTKSMITQTNSLETCFVMRDLLLS